MASPGQCPREVKRRRIADVEDDQRTHDLVSNGVLALTPKSRKRVRPAVSALSTYEMNHASSPPCSPSKRARVRTEVHLCLSDRQAERPASPSSSSVTLRHEQATPSEQQSAIERYTVSVHQQTACGFSLPRTVSIFDTLSVAEHHAFSCLPLGSKIEAIELGAEHRCVIAAWRSRDVAVVVAQACDRPQTGYTSHTEYVAG